MIFLVFVLARRRHRQRESQKRNDIKPIIIGLIRANKQNDKFCTWRTLFGIFLCRRCKTTTWSLPAPSATCHEGRKRAKLSDDEFFFLLRKLSAVPKNSTRGKFAYTCHFKPVEIDAVQFGKKKRIIHFKTGVSLSWSFPPSLLSWFLLLSIVKSPRQLLATTVNIKLQIIYLHLRFRPFVCPLSVSIELPCTQVFCFLFKSFHRCI